MSDEMESRRGLLPSNTAPANYPTNQRNILLG
jgi:hypothetical protein